MKNRHDSMAVAVLLREDEGGKRCAFVGIDGGARSPNNEAIDIDLHFSNGDAFFPESCNLPLGAFAPFLEGFGHALAIWNEAEQARVCEAGIPGESDDLHHRHFPSLVGPQLASVGAASAETEVPADAASTALAGPHPKIFETRIIAERVIDRSEIEAAFEIQRQEGFLLDVAEVNAGFSPADDLPAPKERG